jgi:hypothetical protein
MLDIRFTPEAESTYRALVGQLQSQWGEKYVTRFELRVEKALNQISISPTIYPIILENHELRKCVLHKNCSLFYKVYDRYILVTWFWDNRQQPLIT